MRSVVAIVMVVACSTEPPAPPTGAIDAHVTHYAYTFDLDSRAAHATLTATVDTGGDCWQLPFRAQGATAVELGGAPARSAVVDAATLVACGAGWPAGATLVLDVDTTIPLATLGPSQVGYSITRDADGNPFYYLVSWIGGCDRFAPCDSRPDRFATYAFDVTHPAALTVRCPGTIGEPSPTETTCTFDHDGGPTYSTFGIAAYPAWTQRDEGTWGGVKVTLYDRASTGIAAAIDPAYHAGYVSWLASELGPYPYGDELRVLTAPTYWNGFEHPGNIVLADTLAHQRRPPYANNVAHVLDHEIAHMWAGDQTTLAGTYDFVWKESMAEYLSFVWEDTSSPTAGLVTAGAWKGFAAGARYFPVPADKPDLFAYYGDVYGPGPMILFRQLEVMSSRAQVLAAIKSVLGHPHALTVDELVAALARETGLDLTAYARAWIHGSGAPAWPSFALVFTAATGTSTLAVHQTNPSVERRGCKFHVALHGAAADQVALVVVDTFAGGADQTLTVPTPAFAVTSLVLDPLDECLVYLASSSPRASAHPWRSEHRFSTTARDPGDGF